MKHILSSIKKELVNSFNLSESLAKKVSVAQEAYFKDKNNEFLFKNWLSSMEELSKNEQASRHLKSAYKSMCSACEVQEQEIEELLSESADRQAKKAARKPRAKKSNTETKEESQAK